MKDLTTFDPFTAAYIAAALTLADEEIGTERNTVENLAPAALAKMVADCLKFQTTADTVVYPGYDWDEINPEQTGADFWLSRNGYGAGFFDRPELYGDTEAGKLQDFAQSFGPADLYLGDDQQIYHYPAA